PGILLSEPKFLPCKLRCRRWNSHGINVRTACQRYAPVRHRTLRIEFCGLLKRADRRAVIESVKEAECLIEIEVYFLGVSRDLARVGAETVIKWFLCNKHVPSHEHDRGTEEDLKDLVLRFHSGQKLGHRNGLSSAVTEVASMIVSAHGRCRLGVVERCGTSRTPHLVTRATPRRHRSGAADSTTVRRAFG